MVNTETVFLQGFRDACRGYKLLSAREVAVAYAHFTSEQIGVYLNGQEDAARGDFSRLPKWSAEAMPRA